MEENKSYGPQKKYLAKNKKQLHVWVNPEKYQRFKELVAENGTSVYALINQYIQDYIDKYDGEKADS